MYYIDSCVRAVCSGVISHDITNNKQKEVEKIKIKPNKTHTFMQLWLFFFHSSSPFKWQRHFILSELWEEILTSVFNLDQITTP